MSDEEIVAEVIAILDLDPEKAIADYPEAFRSAAETVRENGDDELADAIDHTVNKVLERQP